MKKRILSLLLALVMVVSLVPMSAMAAVPDSVEVYSTSNGAWGEGLASITKVHISGIAVTGTPEWSNNTCNITLAEGTDSDAEVTFNFKIQPAGNSPALANLRVTLSNGAGASVALSLNNSSGTIKLNGSTTTITATLSAPYLTGTTTKTFVFTIPNPNHVPTLADPENTGYSATVDQNSEHTLNLSNIFTDEDDGDTLRYQVKTNDDVFAEATVVDGVYTFPTDNVGDFKYEFKAVDSKGATSEATYTVNMKVTPVNTSEDNYSTEIILPENVSADFYTLGGEVGAPTPGTSLNATKAEDSNSYTVEVPEDNDTLYVKFADRYLVLKVEEGEATTIREITVGAEDKFGTNVETTDVTVVDGDGCAASGADNAYYLAVGKTYTASATPKETSVFAAGEIEKTIGGDDTKIAVPVAYKSVKIIKTPANATAELFVHNKYYSNTEYPCRGHEVNDGTWLHYFAGLPASLPGNPTITIYRVTCEDKIVKAGWSNPNSTVTVSFSESDPGPNVRPVYSNVGYNGYIEDSVLLNVNGQNHLPLAVDGTTTLKAYRAWEIIPIAYNNWIIEPDFHFNVVSESAEGVVTLEDMANPMTGGESWQKLTGKKTGLAVIEVTYDAIDISSNTNGHYVGRYGASDPNRSGLVVVQVGGNAADVDFGIDCLSGMGSTTYNEGNAKKWDAEFDTLYFTGDSGRLKLSPTSNSGAITEVAVSNDKGNSWATLSPDNGTYTATIVPGNNIIRVTTENGTAYQVVRGDKITVRLINVTRPGESFAAGDTVRVVFEGLHMPIPKMAGNYNPGTSDPNDDGRGYARIRYTFENAAIEGNGTQYNFITAENCVEVTIPADTDKTEFALTGGYIGLGVIGLENFVNGGDSHRNIPDSGAGTRDDETTFHTRSLLPDVTIAIGAETAPNTPPVVRDDAPNTASLELTEEVYKYEINLNDVFTDADSGDTLRYTVKIEDGAETEVQDGYFILENPAVGEYELHFTASDGVDTVEHTITLTVTISTSEPEPEPEPEDNQVKGYVYVSFEDHGRRVAGESGVRYPYPLGTIISSTQVPFYEGDTIADVTLRLLESRNMTYSHDGDTKANFYLVSIGNFAAGGSWYSSFGQFDGGNGSGWMITHNNVFIGRGASDFIVKNGDVIEWQYTCRLGEDIGGGVGDNFEDEDKTDDSKLKFADVAESDYFYEAVKWAAEKGITGGTSATTFSPHANCTRAQMVTFLWRAAGSPEPSAEESVFGDVDRDSYYYKALLWAVENGITNGTGDTTFSPNADCNRGQMATFLYRSAKNPAVSGEHSFIDVKGDAYYNNAVIWAAAEGITNGTGANTFSPDADCTRAQMVTFLYRYLAQ